MNRRLNQLWRYVSEARYDQYATTIPASSGYHRTPSELRWQRWGWVWDVVRTFVLIFGLIGVTAFVVVGLAISTAGADPVVFAIMCVAFAVLFTGSRR